MGLLPNSRLGQIQFYEFHITPWTANAVAIGLEVPDVTAFSAKILAARAAFTAAEQAREAAKAATLNFYEKVAAMGEQGADFIRTIRNYALTTNNANVYVLAQIPAPPTPAPAPPPGQPFEFRVELLTNGFPVLSWKCNNPPGTGGTIYEVRRRVGPGPGGPGSFEFVGSTGTRTFTDETVPSSAATLGLTYQITAVRSTTRGLPGEFNLNFGVGGDGVAVASGGVEGSLKMAA